MVGVPKTIDNDISATDYTFGFDTALSIATDAVDRIATTAEAHNRIMLVEVMGRTKGWIATYAAIAGGADALLIPEIPYDLDDIARNLKRRHRQGRTYSVVVVAEGVAPPAGSRHPNKSPRRLRVRAARRRGLPNRPRARRDEPVSRRE